MDKIDASDIYSVTKAAVKAAKWVFLSAFMSNFCQAIFGIVLARLLGPSEFGLIAYATMFMGFVNLIQDIGLRQALIQRKDNVEASADIVFTINIIMGGLWYIGSYIVAPYMADFFSVSLITPILRIMALSFLIIPLGSVQNTLLAKQLHFNKLFFLGLIPTFIPGLTSIILAFVGCGVWSLVIGSLMGASLNVIVIWIVIPWRPTWRFDPSLARQILKFGWLVSFESLLSWSVNTIDDVLVGKWLGGTALGLYSLGFKIGIAPAKYISSALIQVAFPAFSKLQNNKEAIRNAFLKSIKHISIVSFPIGVGIATTASLFVPVFLGDKWIKAVPIIQFISLYGVFMSIGSLLPQIYKALGRPDIYLKYVVIRCFVAVPVYFHVVSMGLTAISIAHLALTTVFFPINLYIGMRIMSIPFKKLMDVLWMPISGVMGIVFTSLFLQKFIFKYISISSGMMLAVTVAVSSAIYISHIFYVSHDTFWEMKKLIKSAIA